MKKQCKIRGGSPTQLGYGGTGTSTRGDLVKPRFTRCTLTKTLCFTEANAKRTIDLKTSAVKKGDFRGKLSLGSTSPLSPTLRSKKIKAERLAERLFFFKEKMAERLAERFFLCMTLARRYE